MEVCRQLSRNQVRIRFNPPAGWLLSDADQLELR